MGAGQVKSNRNHHLLIILFDYPLFNMSGFLFNYCPCNEPANSRKQQDRAVSWDENLYSYW
jgi:hypothetical protein